MSRIVGDQERYRRIIRGKVRENLKEYISNHDLIGRKGKDSIRIPIPNINIPRFKFDPYGSGGVGQGDGEPGDSLGKDGSGEGGEAGEMPGEHDYEVEVTIDELADILGEELELPKIEPKGHRDISSDKFIYRGIKTSGSESLRHFKKTYQRAIKRQISTGIYNPDNPAIIPTRDDRKYRATQVVPNLETNAVIFYMMDVSGSMGKDEKQRVRTTSFWIDAWLSKHYPGLKKRFITHCAEAKEVNEETFYHTRESGGTKMSSAYKLCAKIIEEEYNLDQWNIYPFHFSDGENLGGDNKKTIEILEQRILPVSNMFCYGQCFHQGGFHELLIKHFELDSIATANGKVRAASIVDDDEIIEAIEEFLGAGR